MNPVRLIYLGHTSPVWYLAWQSKLTNPYTYMIVLN